MLLTRETLPETIPDIAALDDLLCRPSQALIDDLAKVDGDIMILGVAGKMGPTLARPRQSRRCPTAASSASRASAIPASKDWLQARGIETHRLRPARSRPRSRRCRRRRNIVFMAGRKFGAEGNPSLTWAMNVHVPALVAQAFPASRIVAFSTGCVYPFVPVDGSGADRGHGAQPARRIRPVLRRPRAHVRIFLAQVRHARPPVPAQLRDRHALRRAARHRAPRCCTGKPIDVSHGPRQRHLAGRCLRAGAALPCALRRRRPRRSMSAAPRSSRCASSPQKFGARLRPRAGASPARRSRRPG